MLFCGDGLKRYYYGRWSGLVGRVSCEVYITRAHAPVSEAWVVCLFYAKKGRFSFVRRALVYLIRNRDANTP